MFGEWCDIGMKGLQRRRIACDLSLKGLPSPDVDAEKVLIRMLLRDLARNPLDFNIVGRCRDNDKFR